MTALPPQQMGQRSYLACSGKEQQMAQGGAGGTGQRMLNNQLHAVSPTEMLRYPTLISACPGPCCSSLETLSFPPFLPTCECYPICGEDRLHRASVVILSVNQGTAITRLPISKPLLRSGIGPCNCLMATHCTDGETETLSRGVLAPGHKGGTI